MPDEKLKAPKLSLDHYMATETGYDGGNVKYRVNGGKFEVIPTAAYINNGPAGHLATEADGNTNPLAGQPGFTGTDGGSGFGSWGQSQVDLSMLGIAGGDEVEFRFDIGRDGCGGNDGWYVDNVAVSVCRIKTTADAVHAAQPSTYGKASKVKVSVSPVASTGVVGGTVALYNGHGSLIGRTTLVNGKAVFTLSRTLSTGRRVMTVKYLGNGSYLADPTRQPSPWSGSADLGQRLTHRIEAPAGSVRRGLSVRSGGPSGLDDHRDDHRAAAVGVGHPPPDDAADRLLELVVVVDALGQQLVEGVDDRRA